MREGLWVDSTLRAMMRWWIAHPSARTGPAAAAAGPRAPPTASGAPAQSCQRCDAPRAADAAAAPRRVIPADRATPTPASRSRTPAFIRIYRTRSV